MFAADYDVVDYTKMFIPPGITFMVKVFSVRLM